MDRNLNVDLIKSLQPTFSPLVFCHAPCLLTFNSLPIDMNIRYFLRSIVDARALLSFCSMIKGFASHKNGRPEFWIFCIKLLLDMLPTLTTLQQRKSHLYSPEDLNHLWTCPYILPDLNPCLTHRSEVIKFRDSCLSSFLSLKFLDTSFQTGFSTLDCWDYDTPSPSCFWLTRGLLPAHLTTFLKQYFPLSVIYKTISPLLNDFQVELYGEI
ncbi:hypothetical protein GLOIN_2v1785823 [Rhizophagus irregularis DAOM 181602=DAOM 197198]|nr:hypothetical protein GLOIN_2v1785823 [Rhizophagus irregularis DAOM 181602=DAOM 197198]